MENTEFREKENEFHGALNKKLGLTNMWKAFPSPLMVNEYHDKYW